MGFTKPRVRDDGSDARTRSRDTPTGPDPRKKPPSYRMSDIFFFCPFRPSRPAVSRLFAPPPRPRPAPGRPWAWRRPRASGAPVTIRTQHALEKMFTMSTSMTTLKARVAAKAVAVRVLDRPRESWDGRARERGARDAEGILTRDQYLARRGIARALSTMVIVGRGGCAECGTSGGENGEWRGKGDEMTDECARARVSCT